MNPKKRLEEEEEERIILSDKPKQPCRWKSVLLGDVLPGFGLLVLVFAFILAGAGIFMKLESGYENS